MDLGSLAGVDVAPWSAAYNGNGNGNGNDNDVGNCPGGLGYLPFPG
jgi:hypothetical protein